MDWLLLWLRVDGGDDIGGVGSCQHGVYRCYYNSIDEKKAGFPAKFAAGTEAAASTGGQLMPPIMGAGAFVMATYTQISYNTIVLVSILPAILYLPQLLFFVRIEAKRSFVTALDGEKVSAVEVMKKGGIVFLAPIGVLIALLIYGFTPPTYAAGLSILAVVVSSWFSQIKWVQRRLLKQWHLVLKIW